MVASGSPTGELGPRLDDGIDLAAKCRLCSCQCIHGITQRRVTDHEQVNVALVRSIAAGGRPEDKGEFSSGTERGERGPQSRDDVGLDDDAAELLKDRALRVGLVVDLSAALGAPEDARRHKDLQFPLHGTYRPTGAACDLARVERLVGLPEQQAQHLPPGDTKQGGRDTAWLADRPAPHERNGRAWIAEGPSFCACSHYGNKCIHFGNILQAPVAARHDAFARRCARPLMLRDSEMV